MSHISFLRGLSPKIVPYHYAKIAVQCRKRRNTQMKRMVTEEKTFCDFCKEETAWDKCELCQKDICYDCKKTKGKEYSPLVYFDTSGHFYCHPCDNIMTEQSKGINPQEIKRYKLLRVVESLRHEYRGFLKDFEKRKKEAEEKLEGKTTK